jgi:hypothetical protein
MFGLLHLGGAEIILILVVLLVLLGIPAAVVLGIILFRTSRSKPPHVQSFAAPPPAPANPAPDLEQELRTLAKLKNEGLITEEDFNQKKKTLLGI